MKRITAWILTGLMLWGLMPTAQVYGATVGQYDPYPYGQPPVKQPPVSWLQVLPADTGQAGSSYIYSVSWQQPVLGSRDMTAPWEDNGVDGPVPGSPQYPEGYEIYYRNATRSQAFNTQNMDNVMVAQTDRQLTRTFTKALDPGSLYEMMVTPYHDNFYYGPANNSGIRTFEARRAPAETGSNIVEKRAVYLTDIEVWAVGEGKSLAVTWSNPTWGGTSVFDAYEISYQIRGDKPEYIGYDRSKQIPLRDITVNRDGTLTYVINDETLQTGYSYDVKVEPMKEGRRVRPVPGSADYSSARAHSIDINGVTYYLAYRNENDYEYRAALPAMITPSLRWAYEGDDYIRLYWDSLAGSPDQANIVRVEVWELDPVTLANTTLLGSISKNSVLSTNFWLTKNTKASKAYQLVIYKVNDNGEEEGVKTLPVYFDPSYSDFAPYTPKVLELLPGSGQRSLDLTWLAFAREPHTEDESNYREFIYDNKYIDRDITYDIYVTDNYANLEDPTFYAYPVMTINGNEMQVQAWSLDPNDPGAEKSPSYKQRLTRYYAKDAATGEYVDTTPLGLNKVYYVRIVATRDQSKQSAEALGSVYLQSTDPLDMIPLMISAPPLRVVKDKITTSAIPTEWDVKYVEIYRPEDETWHAMVGVDKNGALVYGKAADALESSKDKLVLNDLFDEINSLNTQNPNTLYPFLQEAAGKIAAELKRINASANVPSPVTLRVIDLSGASYEIHTVEYQTMIDAGGYENYLNNNLIGDTTDARWTTITPVDGNKAGSKAYTVTGLKSNTPYVIYLRPYVMSGGKKTSYYPNYVMATTLDVKLPVEVDPTTPTLKPGEATDMTLEVYWKYSTELEYEIAYSDRLASYPNSGTVLNWPVINATARVPEGGENMYFTIPDLFPDTTYYIWIRARVVSASGTKLSEWSNPIDMKTLDIQAPIPPSGLGAVGADLINAYNRLNGTTYTSTEEKALNILWMRDSNDTAPLSTGGTAAGGTATALSLAELENMYMVRFDGLVANRSYYIRAKTVLTVTRTGTANVKTYNYIVQLSDDPDFRDYTEFTIPAMPALSALDPVFTKRKESKWCTTIRLVTKRTTGEYDGDVNPDQYPLPTQDWEITYDNYEKKLTFRFRTNQKDASGAKDQSVDQRFISRLVADRTYVYSIDLTDYRSRTVNNRVVELPYSILKAFDERKITLELTVSNMVASIPPGSFDTASVRALPDMGANASVRVTFSDSFASKMPGLDAGNRYVSQPQKMTAQVSTPTRTIAMDYFAKPVSLAFKLDSRVTPMDQNVSLYTSTANTGGWERVNSQYNPTAAALNTSAYSPGSYAAIAKTAPQAQANDPSRDAYYRVTAKVDITDMNSYNPSESVSPSRFNNLVAAVAMNRPQATINTALSDADSQALSKAGLLVSGAMTREAATSALVSLYELKTKRIVNPSDTVETTPYMAIRGASEPYRRNLLKAADIGMIDGTFNPKSGLTMGDFMQMLDIVIQDAGM